MAVIVDQWRLGGRSHSTVGTIADIAPAAGDSQRLVDAGNTVMVIEHNRDVICGADWIIELGPAGGNKGGQMIFEGTPTAPARHELAIWLVG